MSSIDKKYEMAIVLEISGKKWRFRTVQKEFM